MRAPFIIHSEPQEVADIHQAEDEANWRGHCVSALIVKELRTREVKCSPSRFERTSALCQDVTDPIRVESIGQGDGEAIPSPKDVDGGSVLTP
jgi:hypothetical protein